MGSVADGNVFNFKHFDHLGQNQRSAHFIIFRFVRINHMVT